MEFTASVHQLNIPHVAELSYFSQNSTNYLLYVHAYMPQQLFGLPQSHHYNYYYYLQVGDYESVCGTIFTDGLYMKTCNDTRDRRLKCFVVVVLTGDVSRPQLF